MKHPLPVFLPIRTIPCSQVSMRAQRYSHIVTFPWWRVDSLRTRVSASEAPCIDCLPVVVPTGMITASKCISNLLWSWYPISRGHHLQVYIETHPIMGFKSTWSRPPCAYLQTSWIWASKCISTLARFWPPNSLQACPIMASTRISMLA